MKLICPFRKNVCDGASKYKTEKFAVCDGYECGYYSQHSEELPQRKPFTKKPIFYEYFCNHPSGMYAYRIKENHIIYNNLKLGEEMVE